MMHINEKLIIRSNLNDKELLWKSWF